MAEGAADTEEEDGLSRLNVGEWRQQIEVSEERAAQRLRNLQEVNNDILKQLRILSVDDNEVKSDYTPFLYKHAARIYAIEYICLMRERTVLADYSCRAVVNRYIAAHNRSG